MSIRQRVRKAKRTVGDESARCHWTGRQYRVPTLGTSIVATNAKSYPFVKVKIHSTHSCRVLVVVK